MNYFNQLFQSIISINYEELIISMNYLNELIMKNVGDDYYGLFE